MKNGFLFFLLIILGFTTCDTPQNKSVEFSVTHVFMNLDSTNYLEMPSGITFLIKACNNSNKDYVIKNRYKYYHSEDSTIQDNFIIETQDSFIKLHSMISHQVNIPSNSCVRLAFFCFIPESPPRRIKEHSSFIDSFYRNVISKSNINFINYKKEDISKVQIDTIDIKKDSNIKVLFGPLDWQIFDNRNLVK
jgi:hypothetical protein